MMHEQPPAVELQRSQDRRPLHWAVFWFALAVFIAVVVSAMVVVPYIAQQRIVDRETICRARITNIVLADNAKLQLDQAKALLDFAHGIPQSTDVLAAAADDLRRNDGVVAIQKVAVDVCHANPSYRIPKDLMP